MLYYSSGSWKVNFLPPSIPFCISCHMRRGLYLVTIHSIWSSQFSSAPKLCNRLSHDGLNQSNLRGLYVPLFSSKVPFPISSYLSVGNIIKLPEPFSRSCNCVTIEYDIVLLSSAMQCCSNFYKYWAVADF